MKSKEKNGNAGGKSIDNTMLILMPKIGLIEASPEARTHAMRVRNPSGDLLHEEHGREYSCFLVRNGTKVRFYVVHVRSAIYVDLVETVDLA